MPDFTEMKKEFESKDNESTNSVLASGYLLQRGRVHDIVLGLFGWVILSNLVFWLVVLLANAYLWAFDTFVNVEHLFIIVHLLPTIIIALILVIKKKLWVCIGIVSAVIINAILWIIVTKSPTIIETALVFVPFPSSFMLLRP